MEKSKTHFEVISMKSREIRSKHGVVGVRLYPRGKNDHHIIVRLLQEDDGHWWDTSVSFSSAWIDEYIKVLQAAKSMCEAEHPDIIDGTQYGWKFKG